MVVEWGEIHQWVKGKAKQKDSLFAYSIRGNYIILVLVYYIQIGIIAFFGFTNTANTGIYQLFTNGFVLNPTINGTIIIAEILILTQINIYRLLDSMAEVESRLFKNTEKEEIRIRVTTPNKTEEGKIDSIGDYLIISNENEISSFEWKSLKELTLLNKKVGSDSRKSER